MVIRLGPTQVRMSPSLRDLSVTVTFSIFDRSVIGLMFIYLFYLCLFIFIRFFFFFVWDYYSAAGLRTQITPISGSNLYVFR
jgi:hypothetical protein